MLEFIHKKVKGKRVVLLGFGLEGQSTLRFLLSDITLFPHIVVMDRSEAIQEHPLITKNKISCFIGEDYQDHLLAGDFIIKSPGVKLKGAQQIIPFSQTSLFLEFYQQQVIGVTGTKGKSTTSSMIYQVFKAQDKEVVLLGNIGKPAFDMIEAIKDDTWVVYELSAHQLQHVWQGPKYAILLNLMPEHLDYFESEIDYFTAKLNIFRRQGQQAFSYISPSVTVATTEEAAFKTILKDHQIFYEDKVLLGKADLKYLYGDHHISNIHPLIELVLFVKLNLEQALHTICEFHPLPHRQEFLGNKNGLIFINDSISTIPQSAIQAVLSIKKVDYLIIGGVDRGIDYSVLVDFLSTFSCTKVFFLGEAGSRILEALLQQKKPLGFEYRQESRLQEIKDELLEIKKGTVLLSPAAASYDAFTNFEERGNYFREIFSEILGRFK